MKVYIAEDWTGCHVFADKPRLMECGGMPPIWSGHKLPFQLAEDMKIPRGQYLERNIWWSLIRMIK